MPGAGDAKRGSKVWGPPGGTAGICLTCGGPARSSRAFYCEEHRQGTAAKSGEAAATKAPPAASSESEDAEPGDLYGDSERTPASPKPESTVKSRVAKMWGNREDKSASSPAPKSDERRPVQAKRRTSTASFWGDVISPASAIAARAGYVPMSRAMQWSSPVAGDIIEDATKGTPIDRVVQPLVRNSEKWQDLFDLFGFWAAIGVAQRNPMAAPQALTFARARFVNLLPRIAANIKKERAKERSAAEALTELMPDIRELFPEFGPDDDPIDLLIQSLFAAPDTEMAGVP